MWGKSSWPRYIAFTVFALLCLVQAMGTWLPRNILTGIFVDSALQNGQEEKRRFLLQEVGQLFKEADKAKQGHRQSHRKEVTMPLSKSLAENPVPKM